MKKLIIAAYHTAAGCRKAAMVCAIVCAAVASEAATFKWYTGDVAYMPYAISSIKEGTAQPSATSKESKTLETWAGEGAVFTATLALSLDGGSTWATTDNVAIETTAGNIDISGLDNDNFVKPATEGTQNNITYKIVINGTYNDGATDWVLASSPIEGEMPLTSIMPNELTTGVPGSWDISKAGSPVPEPTSGLMLLLGVGALALRRKQK